VPDAVGEGQAERSADDYPQDGAANVAATHAGTEATASRERSGRRQKEPVPVARPTAAG
jgi:hypothetical protein